MQTSTLPPIAELAMSVRWGDQDRYCHVNNVAHFQYFEEARSQWLAALGFPMHGQGTGAVLLKTEAIYFKEINYPCQLIIKTWVRPPGNTSLGLLHQIVDAATAVLYAEGKVKLVWVNHASGKPIALPAQLRQLATAHGVQ